ncbi:hypothetical protein CLOM_g6327 [Closterium sp. NIES-68]|nr:hypothetical protein CLOM_g6327 [Closterium sp. NIES-68]
MQVFLGRLASVAQAYAMLRLRRLHDTRGPASTNSLCRSRTICCNRRPDNNASINIPLPGTLRGSASLPCWMPCGSAARLTSRRDMDPACLVPGVVEGDGFPAAGLRHLLQHASTQSSPLSYGLHYGTDSANSH